MVGIGKFRQITPPAEQGGYKAVPFRIVDGFFHIRRHARKGAQIVFNVAGRFGTGNPDVFRKGKSADPVNDPEIHRFCPAAQFGGDHIFRQAENLGSGHGVNIGAFAEGFNHIAVICQARQHPQLDLGIIGVAKNAAFRRREVPAQAAPLIGANRDIL